MKKGMVHLVGAGPGDPGLITVHGLARLRGADVVIYDNLCNPMLLRETQPGIEIIYAGKHSGQATLAQSRIERLMIRRALQGRDVVRLKGGDPFVFGRGAEEAAALRRAGVPFDVTPGVTSAIAVPAYAGIPPTHREHSSGLAIVTAYEDPGKGSSLLDYEVLARFPGTLLFLMGVKRLEPLVTQLCHFGKPKSTPVALVRWGTRGFQETLVGTLGDIVTQAQAKKFSPPAVIVVGDVVRCRKTISWFERLPLFGRRIVVTRSRDQAGEIARRLRELGAEALELPAIELVPARGAALRRAVRQAEEWDWIIFASGPAVDFFLDAVLAGSGDLRALARAKLAVLGASTAARLTARGLKAFLQPKMATASGLRAALRRRGDWRGRRVLLPRSGIGGREIENALRSWGARVSAVTAYRNRRPRLTWEWDAIGRVGADTVVFTSSSTAENFGKLLGERARKSTPAAKVLKACRYISIGPSTSATLQKMGLKVHAQARTPSIEGLIAALKRMAPVDR